VEAEEARLAQRLAQAGSETEEEELGEDELLLARMSAGLYTLQQCCLIIANLWAAGDVALRKRVVMLLHQQGASLARVKELLLEHYRSVGDDGDAEEAERLRRKWAARCRAPPQLPWRALAVPPLLARLVVPRAVATRRLTRCGCSPGPLAPGWPSCWRPWAWTQHPRRRLGCSGSSSSRRPTQQLQLSGQPCLHQALWPKRRQQQ
jgi:hypothetical protein